MTEAENALQFIDSHDREVWRNCGMALKETYGDAAFQIWDSWSATASNYDAAVAKEQWKSFKSGKGIKSGTLFHYAKLNGYVPDRKYIPPTPEQLESRRREAEARQTVEGIEIAKAQAKAAQKAREMLSQCELSKHAYLDYKGFKESIGNVLRVEDKDPLLIVPMYYNGSICGTQSISINGEKKFIYGQRCNDAYFKIGNEGQLFLAEGYATALSINACLSANKMKSIVVACFSANNVGRIAKMHQHAIIIADNDSSGTGERVAKESGCKYWMPDKVGTDFNDLHKAHGLFRTAQLLRKVLQSFKNTV